MVQDVGKPSAPGQIRNESAKQGKHFIPSPAIKCRAKWKIWLVPSNDTKLEWNLNGTWMELRIGKFCQWTTWIVSAFLNIAQIFISLVVVFFLIWVFEKKIKIEIENSTSDAQSIQSLSLLLVHVYWILQNLRNLKTF